MSSIPKSTAFRLVCARLQELRELYRPDVTKLYLAYEISATIIINSEELVSTGLVAKLVSTIYRQRKTFNDVELAYYVKIAEMCGGSIPTRSVYDLTNAREDIAALRKVATSLDFYRYTLATRLLAVRSGEDVMKYLRDLSLHKATQLKSVEIGPIHYVVNTPTKTASFRAAHVTLSGNASVMSELLTLGSLNHPLFCKVLGVDSTLVKLSIHVVDAGTPIRTHHLTTSMIADAMLQLARGLSYMHSVSLVHCNLTSTNVLYRDGKVTLIGCSKAARITLRDRADLSHLTPDGVPPEGWEDPTKTPLSFAVDAWGLAALILSISKEYSMFGYHTSRGLTKAAAITRIRLHLAKATQIPYYALLVKLFTPNADERMTMEEVCSAL